MGEEGMSGQQQGGTREPKSWVSGKGLKWKSFIK